MNAAHRKAALRYAGVALLFVTLTASTQSTAYSPATSYDPNCKPVQPTEAQQVGEEVCTSHAGCRLVAAVVEKTCKAANFFRDLGTSTSPSGQITNEDVIDAATADVPTTSTGQRIIDNARNAAKKAYGAVGELFRTSDGQVGYAETSPTSGGMKSGSIISANGTMAIGQFDHNNRLNGPGQLITPDGQMRAGTFTNNTLNGPGIITDQDGNRTVLVEGTFDGDTPVGEVVRTYADGSKVREIWENGQMVERGKRVPKGQIPPPVQRPQVELASTSPAGRNEGLNLVAQPDGQRRYELWCKGRMVDAGKWSSLKSLLPEPPRRLVCEETKLAEVDDDEVEHKDAIQRTLGPPKFKPGAGTGGQGSFPCPLGGTADLYSQLRPCLDVSLSLYADRSSVVSRCQAQFVQAGVSLGEAFGTTWQGMMGMPCRGCGSKTNLNYPWGNISPDKVARMSRGDVEYVNRKLVEDQLNALPKPSQPGPPTAAERAVIELYGRLQECIGRFALCRAGNSQFCR